MQIGSPRFSFVRFGEQDQLSNCAGVPVLFCLPVYSYDDVAFQAVVDTDTKEEADAFCDGSIVEVGLVAACDDEDFTINYANYYTSLYPEVVRVAEKRVLLNWSHGFPAFDEYFAPKECFRVRIKINHPTAGVITACSNCFERITEDCWTSVIDYGSDQNSFGFNYCGGGDGDEETTEQQCYEAHIVEFNNVASLTIPYTSGMRTKYGDVPNVEVWILDNGKYVKPIIQAGFDAYPPTQILLDFGGVAEGFVKIS